MQSSRIVAWGLPLAAAIVMGLRAPQFLTAPRFWAEEGSIYFAHAWSHPWWETLWLAPPGYLTLWANGAAVLATRMVGLSAAPLITTMLAMLVQLLPVALIATSEAPIWDGVGRKLLGVAIVLFASLNGEIWLTTTGSHFHFSLVAALLLLEPRSVRPGRALAGAAVLGVGGLSGANVCFLAPLFVLRAAVLRRPQAVLLAGVILVCAAVQAGLLWAASQAQPEMLAVRGEPLELRTFAAVVWARGLVLPTAGVDATVRFLHVVVPLLSLSVAGAVAAGLLGLAAALLFWWSRHLPPVERWALSGAYLVLLVPSIVASLGDKQMFLRNPDAASRYFYAPGALLLMLLLRNVQCAPRGSRRALVCGALLALGLGSGVFRYRSALGARALGPDWRHQVKLWERLPGYELLIWPAGWKVVLTPRPAAVPPDGGTAFGE